MSEAHFDQRCETCLGMGYKGRYRKQARGKVWKIETCRVCNGRGAVPATQTQRPRRSK